MLEIHEQQIQRYGGATGLRCARLAYDIILLEVFPGLRRGEILALQYRDVDLVRRGTERQPVD